MNILSHKILVKGVFLALVFIFINFILVVNFVPRETFEVGERSSKDIKSPRSAKYRDIAETEKLKEEKIRSIPKYYQEDPAVIMNVEHQLDDIFEKIKITSNKKLKYLTFEILKETLSDNIRSDVPQDLEEARVKMRKKIENQALPSPQALIVSEICDELIQPNYIYDEKETKKQRNKAAQKIRVVEKIISAGDTILYKGKIITPQDIVKLKAVGLMMPEINIPFILHILILNAVFFLVLIYLMMVFDKGVRLDEKMLFLIGVVVLSGMVFSKFLSFISSGYLSILPMVSVVQILVIFVNPLIAVVISVILGLYNGIILNNELKFAIIGIVSCLVGIAGVRDLHHRQDIVRAGLLVSVVQIFCILSFSVISTDTPFAILTNISMGIINGIGSSILTVGGLYFLERPWGIVSPIRLLELTSASEPLVKRLMIEAPGTYNHSVYIGNLAENAATLIGANSLLTRVGSYYHDIGKIKRPYFFAENQMNMENLHEKISPTLSASIIKAHVADGVEIARQHKLPTRVIDVIAEHHGTSLVSYFYQQASQENKDVSEEHFRYDSRKPQTKEAALVMLADATEAAVRSISSPDAEKIRALIEKIVRDKVEDGQLDESDLTFKDVNKIIDSFCHLLEGMFHLRVEYKDKETPENMEKNV